MTRYSFTAICTVFLLGSGISGCAYAAPTAEQCESIHHGMLVVAGELEASSQFCAANQIYARFVASKTAEGCRSDSDTYTLFRALAQKKQPPAFHNCQLSQQQAFNSHLGSSGSVTLSGAGVTALPGQVSIGGKKQPIIIIGPGTTTGEEVPTADLNKIIEMSEANKTLSATETRFLKNPTVANELSKAFKTSYEERIENWSDASRLRPDDSSTAFWQGIDADILKTINASNSHASVKLTPEESAALAKTLSKSITESYKPLEVEIAPENATMLKAFSLENQSPGQE